MLPSALLEKMTCLQRSKITGLLQSSRFPYGHLKLFILTALGAGFMVQYEPFVAIVPIVLLVWLVLSASVKTTTVKLIGSHYVVFANKRTELEFIMQEEQDPDC